MSLDFLIPAYVALYLLGATSMAVVIGLVIQRADRQSHAMYARLMAEFHLPSTHELAGDGSCQTRGHHHHHY